MDGSGETAESPGFELEAPARAAYDDGTLSFETGAGLWKMGLDATPWEVEAFAATLAPGAGGVSIEAGRLRGPNGAMIEIQHRNREDSQAPDAAQQLLLGVEAENIPIRPSAAGEALDPTLQPIIAKGRGELRIPGRLPPSTFSFSELSNSAAFNSGDRNCLSCSPIKLATTACAD